MAVTAGLPVLRADAGDCSAAATRRLVFGSFTGLERQMALGSDPEAAIPKHDRTAAILTLGNGPFKVTVVERMILNLDSEALVCRIERWALGHSPGLEHPIMLKTEVVVQARCRVLWIRNREYSAGCILPLPLGSEVFLKSRLAVIIPPESYDHWLSTLDPDPHDLLVPFPSELMKIWPNSTRVNKPDNDDALVLEPVETEEGASLL